MVTVVLVLLALLGTVYLQIAAVDRLASRDVQDGYIDVVVDAIVGSVKKQLKDDIFDDTGKVFNPSTTDAGGADEPYDYPWTNTDINTETVTRFDGGATWPIKGGKFDDRWLAASSLDFSGSVPVWKKITNLTGIYLRLPKSGGSSARPEEAPIDFEPSATAPGVSAYLREDMDVRLLGGTSMASETTNYEALGVDADGDGIHDSRWEWASIKQIGSTAYVMACRIIDASSKINISAATALTNDGATAGGNFELPAPLTGAGHPAKNPRGYYPTNADITRLLKLRDTTRLAESGTPAAPGATFWQSELSAMFTYREVDAANMPGGSTNDSPTPFGLSTIDPLAVVARSRMGHWFDKAKFYGENIIGTTASKYNITDELEILYGNGLNVAGRTTTIEGHLAEALRRDGDGVDNTLETDYLSVLDEATGVTTDPMNNTQVTAAVEKWFQGGSNANIESRTAWHEIRKMITTYSGASILSANHGDLNMGNRVTRYDLVLQDSGADNNDPGNNSTRVQNVFGVLNAVFALGNTATNKYLGTLASAPDTQDVAAEFAANIQDWSDKNHRPTEITLPSAGYKAYGLELMPFIREAYFQVWYKDEDQFMDDGSGNKIAGQDTQGDTWVAKDGFRSVAIEVGNPFDRPIEASELNGRIRVRIMRWVSGTSYTQDSSWTVSGVSGALNAKQKLIFYSNPAGDAGEADGSLQGGVRRNDLPTAANGINLSDATVEKVNAGNGSLTFPVNGGNIAVELQINVDGAGTWVTYDRLFVTGANFPASIDHYAAQSPAGAPVHSHGQLSIGRDSTANTARYLSNRGKAVLASGPKVPNGSDLVAAADYFDGGAGKEAEKLEQDNKGVTGDTAFDDFQLMIANRRFFSVGELAIVPMFGFTDATAAQADADGNNIPDSDLPTRLAGSDGSGTAATGALDPRRRYLDLSATAEVADVPESQGLPHAAMVMDQFTTVSLLFDGQDDDNDDGDFDASDTDGMGQPRGRATSADNDAEQFVPGKININTAPLHIQVLACPLPEPVAWTQDLFEQVNLYRDDPKNAATDTTPTRRAAMTGLPDTNLRVRPGIASIGELLYINPPSATNEGKMQIFALDGAKQDETTAQDLFPMPKVGLVLPTNGADTGLDDNEERIHRFQFLSQLYDVRSDVFILYCVARGYPVQDFRTGAIESARFIAIFDRGNLVDSDDNVRLLGLMRIR